MSIRSVRERKGLSRAEMADLLGISVTRLRRIEKNNNFGSASIHWLFMHELYLELFPETDLFEIFDDCPDFRTDPEGVERYLARHAESSDKVSLVFLWTESLFD
ncbi:MAG: helix-turn-helix transcriptional regulator [Oscillospiraceae bacterium]|nr:helix-turn-helix transcriptional regulator [Oscillospiraceae bacterium]